MTENVLLVDRIVTCLLKKSFIGFACFPTPRLGGSAARRLRVIRYQQATLLREIAEMEQVSSRRSTVGQVGLLHAVTQAAAERKVALADALTSYLPCTLAAMEAGLIDEYAASRAFEATACASEEVAAEIDSQLAGRFENRNPPHCGGWSTRC
ncbi:hypothetical protein [Amycolatopsis minnesotensis]|uniref:hypothetical protein n=1 Tax=Amycolatopsis minnesotensis TaxID=337894 RepID=UPI0031DAEEB8